jgi:excisionase family DNA binding protein
MSEKIETNGNEVTNGAPKLLFGVREAAARLSVSVVSIRKLLRQNRLHRVPNFRKILVSEAELQKFAATTE